uniref:AT12039p n=1 Tax=Drosophila melanogaster TaxID=7227 RepID=A9UNE5_DROME|nr:AT12039p [Drosophila melanogaster]
MAQKIVAGQQADLVAKRHVVVGVHILPSLRARLQINHALKWDQV